LRNANPVAPIVGDVGCPRSGGQRRVEGDKRRVLDLFVARAKLVKDPNFVREGAQAKLIVKVGMAQDITTLVEQIYDTPKPITDEATALLRSTAE
jgi:hypothetical protein